MLEGEILKRHRERVRSRKRWPVVKPKPRTLSAQFGRADASSMPDVVFAHGEGCEKSDNAFLYYVLGVLSINCEFNKVREFDRPKKEPLPNRSILDELAVRGYDITTLRFEIQKLPDPEPVKATEFIPNYEI